MAFSLYVFLQILIVVEMVFTSELTSQVYFRGGSLFSGPPWKRKTFCSLVSMSLTSASISFIHSENSPAFCSSKSANHRPVRPEPLSRIIWAIVKWSWMSKSGSKGTNPHPWVEVDVGYLLLGVLLDHLPKVAVSALSAPVWCRARLD